MEKKFVALSLKREIAAMLDELTTALGDSPLLVFASLVIFSSLATATLIAAVSVISVQWRRLRELEEELALKQDMISRGMSGEDIERTIRASSRRHTWPWSPGETKRLLRISRRWDWSRFWRSRRSRDWCGW